MKTNRSAIVTRMRHASAAVVFVVGIGLRAAPPAGDGDLLAGAPSSGQAVAVESATNRGPDRVVVQLACHAQPEQVAGPKRLPARPPVATRPQFQVEVVGLDLAANQPSERPSAPVPAGQPSPFDFTPGARTIDSLRWTWASVAWKF